MIDAPRSGGRVRGLSQNSARGGRAREPHGRRRSDVAVLGLVLRRGGRRTPTTAAGAAFRPSITSSAHVAVGRAEIRGRRGDGGLGGSRWGNW